MINYIQAGTIPAGFSYKAKVELTKYKELYTLL
jgi:hypothetical protein